MTTEDAQTARIKELEARLAKAEELLTAYVGMLDDLNEESEEFSDLVNQWHPNPFSDYGMFKSHELETIKEARDFIAAKKGE